MTTLSLQLYTLRDELAADADATLAAVAEMGLTTVEPFGIDSFDWLPEKLTAHGLSAPSAHANAIGENQAAVLDAALALGTQIVFQPSSDRDAWAQGSAEALQPIIDAMNATAATFAEKGVRLGYHNHEFEFAHQIEGTTAYEYFIAHLDPSIGLEIDTYWVAFGGHDPVALVTKLGDRVSHLHVKDGPLSGVREDPNLVLGTGAMALDPLLDATTDKVWVVEFDACASDTLTAVGDSVRYLQER